MSNVVDDVVDADEVAAVTDADGQLVIVDRKVYGAEVVAVRGELEGSEYRIDQVDSAPTD